MARRANQQPARLRLALPALYHKPLLTTISSLKVNWKSFKAFLASRSLATVGHTRHTLAFPTPSPSDPRSSKSPMGKSRANSAASTDSRVCKAGNAAHVAAWMRARGDFLTLGRPIVALRWFCPLWILPTALPLEFRPYFGDLCLWKVHTSFALEYSIVFPLLAARNIHITLFKATSASAVHPRWLAVASSLQRRLLRRV